jgi:hypothetical protein
MVIEFWLFGEGAVGPFIQDNAAKKHTDKTIAVFAFIINAPMINWAYELLYNLGGYNDNQ